MLLEVLVHVTQYCLFYIDKKHFRAFHSTEIEQFHEVRNTAD